MDYPRKRRAFPDMSGLTVPEPQGLDIQPQPAPSIMPLPQILPMQQGADPMAQLASMGTKRLMGKLMKKYNGGYDQEDAESAWRSGGSL